jgi:hypothetical protein
MYFEYFAALLAMVGICIASFGSSPVAAAGAFIDAGLFGLAGAIQKK